MILENLIMDIGEQPSSEEHFTRLPYRVRFNSSNYIAITYIKHGYKFEVRCHL